MRAKLLKITKSILKSNPSRLALLAIFFIASFGVVLAQTTTSGPGNPAPVPGEQLEIGDVYGWAWMAQNIVSDGAPEGGGGWLSFNCKPSHCTDMDGDGAVENSERWGTTISLDHQGDDGMFMGQAWSSNYGWMTFEEDTVSECWMDNNYVVSPNIATALINNPGPEVAVVGWGRFISGMDESDDGFDGCVSFSGVNHGVKLNLDTGALSGWAWGGDVVGWVSFECLYCNPGVVLPTSTSISFWAEQNTVLAGGGTVLHWEATNQAPNYVASCVPGNTNNYSHWRAGVGAVGAVGTISTGVGNLPGESTHPINGINANTTYSLACTDRYGEALPTQYVTITVNRGIRGCTDASATNYNPLATIDDNSCVYGPISGCTDPLATNYNPLATIDDGSCNSNPLIPGCTDPTATNYNPLATLNDGSCTYAPISGCTDSTADNYNPLATIDDGSCTYDGDDDDDDGPSLQIFPENPTLIIGSGNYSEDLEWISDDPSALHSCRGEFRRDGVVESLGGWTNVPTLPDPESSLITFTPSYVMHQPVFTSKASAVIDPTTFQFRIICEDSLNGDADVAASANVQMIMRPIEPPVVALRIIDPDISPVGEAIEDISSTIGSMVTLKWDALNVNSCVAVSDVYENTGNNVISTNAGWNGPKIDASDPDYMFENSLELDMTFAGNPSALHPTRFYITCTADDTTYTGGNVNPPSAVIRREVCVGLSGIPFPACGATNGGNNVPTYIEI